MSLKGKIEAIIYAAEEPVTLDQMAVLLREPILAELSAAQPEQTPVLETEPNAEEQNPAETPMGEGEGSPTAEIAAAGVAPEVQQSAEGPAPAPAKKKAKDPELAAVKTRLRELLSELITDYESDQRGIEVRQIAGGYRMATKPEHHDVVVGFAKSLKPPIRLSLPALETLAVIAYKQPVTLPEVSEIRGVDSSGVIATLLDRKLVTTAGRKQVIGRPMLYKTTKEFLMRFGLKDVSELPSMEEFEKLGEAELFDPAATETSLTLENAEAKAEAESASEEQSTGVEVQATQPSVEVAGEPAGKPQEDGEPCL